MTDGLPRRPIASLAITGTADPETLYAGLDNGGVWAYTDSGPAPALAVTPAAASFVATEVGDAASQEFRLASVGTAPVTITSLTVSGSGSFTLSATSRPLPADLAPGEHMTATVTFAPAAIGTSSATLTVGGPDPKLPLAVVPLLGTAVAATPLRTTATPPAGAYLFPQQVVLSANHPATIYYTTDGSPPTTASAVYTDPIPIPATATLRYFARQTSGIQEAVHADRYVIGTGTGTGALSIRQGSEFTSSTTVGLEVLRPTADYTAMQFSVNGTPWTPWQAFWPVRTITLPTGDGIKTVQVRFRDSSGNLYPIDVADTIVLDTRPPQGIISINGGAERAAISTTDPPTTNLTLSLAAVDVNGVTEMQFSTDGLSWTPWEPYATTRSFTIKGTGTRRVYVRFRDAALKQSAATSDGILLATASLPLPVAGGVVINADAVYATSTAVQLVITPPLGATQMSFSRNGLSGWSAWEKAVTPRSYTLSTGDGEKSVYVRFRDLGGNLLGMYGDTIILDSRPPLGFVSINDGAESTMNPQVTLSLGGVDVNGVVEMQVSTGTNWPDTWEGFAPSKVFDGLVGAAPGVKGVYVRFRDTAGKISSVYKDTILLLAP
jgi:hypothetical protein